jgi:hypothetical protein
VQTWHSIPEVQTITEEYFEAHLEPIKEKDPYFVGFRITVRNNSKAAMEIDWNATRYLHNEKDLGVLIFEGIDPETIQGKIPADPIAAGATLTKAIFPMRTIAILPRSQRPEKGKRGFMPGILPAGKNSVMLSLKQNQRQWQAPLSLRLKAETAPPLTK